MGINKTKVDLGASMPMPENAWTWCSIEIHRQAQVLRHCHLDSPLKSARVALHYIGKNYSNNPADFKAAADAVQGFAGYTPVQRHHDR
jgi:hypothetical protein